MAWSGTAWSSAFLADRLTGTAAFDLNSDTLKAALFDNTITPDRAAASAAFAYNAGVWLTAAEVDETSQWAAGGEPVTGVTVSAAGGVVTVNADDVWSSGSNVTATGIHGVFLYDDTLTSPVADQGVSYHWFGGEEAGGSGNFVVVWSASGIGYFTLPET